MLLAWAVAPMCAEDGRVLPMSYPHADVERGLPTSVRCGAATTWSGVGLALKVDFEGRESGG